MLISGSFVQRIAFLFLFAKNFDVYCTPHCISISCIIADISPVVARISSLTERQRCDAVDRNTLMDRQDIGMIICHDMQ